MASSEIDLYLNSLDSLQRVPLTQLRADILEVVPDAEECISYGMPAFRLRGGIVCGFAAFKDHMSFFPFSGSVLGQLSKQLRGYSHSKSALRFTHERPLSQELVAQLIAVRQREIASRRG